MIPQDALPVEPLYVKNFIQLRKIWQQSTPPPPTIPITWIQHIQSLPAWEKELIENNIEVDVQKLLHLINKNEPIMLCSDGGAILDIGSYGSAISDGNVILVGIMGKVPGFRPNSFRSEAYGMLSHLLFLLNLSRFHSLPLQTKLNLWSDNSGLLTRIENTQTKHNPSARKYLFSEIDIEMQITDTLSQLNATVCNFKHVKGHQEDTTPFDQLSWSAKLNIYCDQLATRVLCEQHKPITTVPHLPASKIALQIEQTTITHHIPSQIRRMYSRQAQRVYLTNHHKWSTNTFSSVEWDQFRRIYFSFRLQKRRFITKWVNKILPFNQRQYTWNLATSPKCASCYETENEHHFLRCQNIERRKHHATLHPSLIKVFKKHNIDPTIRQIVLFFTLYDNIIIKTQITQLYQTKYNNALVEQEEIGSNSIYYGFFSRQWIPLQLEYLKYTNCDTSKNQAPGGMAAISITIIKHIHSLWKIRCNHQHRNNPDNSPNYRKLQLLHEIKELYSKDIYMLESDKAILHEPIDSFLDKENCQIQHTIKELTPIINLSIKSASILGTKFRKIDSYFLPICNTTRKVKESKSITNKNNNNKNPKQNIHKKQKKKRRYNNKLSEFAKRHLKVFKTRQENQTNYIHYSKIQHPPEIPPEPDPP